MVDIYSLRDECLRELNRIGIHPKTLQSVVWDEDMEYLGYCTMDEHGLFAVRLSASLKDNYPVAKEIMYHELIHACGSEYMDHTLQWLHLASRCNILLGTHLRESITYTPTGNIII